MLNALRPFIAPALAPFIGALLVYLANRWGIIYSDEQKAKISEGAVTAVLLLFSLAASLSGVIKIAANKKLNKSNAATTELVKAGNKKGTALHKAGDAAPKGRNN